MPSVIIVMLILLCSGLFADEVSLELQTRKANEPFASRSDAIKYLKYETKPDGVVAPEGASDWGRITLGEKSYILCVVTGKEKDKLYLDRDSDQDLAEETPLESKKTENYSFFTLDDLVGEFKVGEKTLTAKMRLVFSPKLTPLRGWMPVCTAYTGKVKIEDKSFTVVWVPGNKPHIAPIMKAISRGPLQRLLVGNKELLLKEVSLKEEKVVLNYTVTVKEDFLPVEVPANLKSLMVFLGRSREICVPIEGKVFLPKGKKRYLYLGFTKKSEGSEYELLVFQRELDVKEDTKIPPPEPLKLALKVQQRKGTVWIEVKLTDTNGRGVYILKNGERLEPPVLKVKDENGKEVAEHKYRCG